MASSVIPGIVSALLRALPQGRGPFALHEPEFNGREREYLAQCIDTGWVSSAGAFVDRFERDLAQYTGATAAVAVMNGTAALHLALHLAGVQPGDEVLVPSLTFIATANAVTYSGAIPHFVDSEPVSCGVDAAKLAEYLSSHTASSATGLINRVTGRPVRVLVVMHAFGHPADLDELLAVCQKFGLTLIEDGAESLGSFYKGRHTGRHGRISTLSFNGNKVVTTGGGGALLFQESDLAQRAKHLSTTAKLAHKWTFYHDEIGYNYRLPNLNAALGCAQLEQLPGMLLRKRALATRYAEVLEGVAGLTFLQEPAYARSNYWLNAIQLDDEHIGMRDELLRACHLAGILARPVWNLMHTLPMYQDCPRMELSCATHLERSLINLPSSPALA